MAKRFAWRRLSDGFSFCLDPCLDARHSHFTPGAGVAIDGKAKLRVILDHSLNSTDCLNRDRVRRVPPAWEGGPFALDLGIAAMLIQGEARSQVDKRFYRKDRPVASATDYFNGHSFDLPVLRYRAMVNRVAPFRSRQRRFRWCEYVPHGRGRIRRSCRRRSFRFSRTR
jgi:hypothetical protein